MSEPQWIPLKALERPVRESGVPSRRVSSTIVDLIKGRAIPIRGRQLNSTAQADVFEPDGSDDGYDRDATIVVVRNPDQKWGIKGPDLLIGHTRIKSVEVDGDAFTVALLSTRIRQTAPHRKERRGRPIEKDYDLYGQIANKIMTTPGNRPRTFNALHKRVELAMQDGGCDDAQIPDISLARGRFGEKFGPVFDALKV
jgi:hypothetical protein